MTLLSSALRKSFWISSAVVGSYAIILQVLTLPWAQRHALYAHKVHSGFYFNVDEPESFGFAKGQVRPFNLSTPDGEVLYGWHILPLNVYAKHEHEFMSEPSAPDPRILLENDPDAKVIINFHGNAGHVAEGWRTDTYRAMVSQPNTHLLTIDYRGFGKSTGFPTEIGLITDGVALLNHALHDLHIPAKRIVILGQSLGTAVSAGVALAFADPTSNILPALPSSPSSPDTRSQGPTVFAGVVLVAPFLNLPSLLLTYRIGGIFPVLSPLRPFPYLRDIFVGKIVDKWPSGQRWIAYVDALTGNAEIASNEKKGKDVGSVQILHAVNDQDISYQQSLMLYEGLVQGRAQEAKGRPKVSLQILHHGGHNRVQTHAPVLLAVMRAFEGGRITSAVDL